MFNIKYLPKLNYLESTPKVDNIFLLKTLKTPKTGKHLARWLIALFSAFVIISFFPWQQNIRGYGGVTSFSPSKRPQNIETAIPGRIDKWYITEGQKVNKGDTILTLSEIKEKFFDPQLLVRLEEQISAKERSIEAKFNKAEALKKQIEALKDARVVKLQQARNKLQQAIFKLTSDSVDYEAEKVRFKNFESIYERNKKLYELGNITLTKFQDVESKYQEGKMKVIGSENKFLESKTEVITVRIDISGIEADFENKISKAESDLNSTLADMFVAEGELAKTRNEYANMSIRNEQYQVIAPQSGIVVKALKAGIGETIKEGEAVATIMPENYDIAVEMYVNAMDVPLVSKGRHVRVEFDGWPALQFSGWPSVAVGTFGGEVKVIDYVNSKNGKFRLLVTPDPNDEPWPEQLRIGGGAKGWVMLDNVPIWFEAWRQLNGFPPSLYTEPEPELKSMESSGKSK